ncbi:hypothetical protein [Wenxinia saemankumensis]|uniref:Uncharacterized protein n=1 Tax=Wenxinia saemankumensis TaxID=1447782 RepID=A0A1M6DT87_9RHOB|nr:hypothetical protein [Wenxinia saemankumensis]SHI76228.1 hypothetical protein SAMN05444417_1580 [Wenxinia saemankumensis]
MIVKVVLLFLVFMAVLAMFGRLRFPGSDRIARLGGGKKCRACGRPRIGKAPCPCGKDRA